MSTADKKQESEKEKANLSANAQLANDLLKDLPEEVKAVVSLMGQAWRIRRRPIREDRLVHYEQVD